MQSSVSEWKARAEHAEAEVSRLAERVREVELKAELAQRSAEEAWRFARTLIVSPRPRLDGPR
jgi:hypothetical protein